MTVYRKFRALVAAAALVPAVGGLMASPAMAKDGDTFGDWTVKCMTPPGATAQECRLMQISTVKEKDGKEIKALRAQVFHLGKTDLVLVSFLPLGYAIPPGVQIAVDEGKQFPMFPQRCMPQGCEIATKIEPELLSQLKKGKEAKIHFHLGGRAGTSTVSLKGLSQALSKF